MLLALATLLIVLVVFSWLGIQSVRQSVDTALDERLVLARVLAGRLDQTLNYVLGHVSEAIQSQPSPPDGARFTPFAGEIRTDLGKLDIDIDHVFLTDRTGKIIDADPASGNLTGTTLAPLPDFQRVLTSGTPGISNLVSGTFSRTPTVLVSVPFVDATGAVSGVLSCSLNVSQISTETFGQDIALGETGYLEIIDGNGIVLARTLPGTPPSPFETSDHPGRFAALIDEHQPTVGTCHRCHTAGSTVQRRKDVLAFAPLAATSWGVVIRQSETETFQPTTHLQHQFLAFGGILLGCMVLPVLALTRSVVDPIKKLTRAARNMAVHDYDVEVPRHRSDEIGELSAAFDTMRREIARSRNEIMDNYRAAKDREELRGRLLENVIDAQEQERKRIARELHDEYGQTLTGLIMNVESLEDMAESERPAFRTKLEKQKEILVKTLAEMRKLTLNLRPSSLDDLGLTAALRAYLSNVQADTGLEIAFDHAGIGSRLSPDTEITVFRIVQEAVHNVVKHARATEVAISLKAADGTLRIEIADNGEGFDVAAVLREKAGKQSLGILGMQERTALLHGTFAIDSHPGAGTRMTVTIPLGPPPA